LKPTEICPICKENPEFKIKKMSKMKCPICFGYRDAALGIRCLMLEEGSEAQNVNPVNRVECATK
jgi:hypothetical protein